MKLIRIFITTILISSVLATVYFARVFPAWAYMSSISIAMYIIFKWITLAFNKNAELISFGSLIYLVGWVGMDPMPFQPSAPKKSTWDYRVLVRGLRNILFGMALFYSIHFFGALHWLLKAWIVCGGIAMVLHFGAFHLLAWFWKGIGYNVEPSVARLYINRDWGHWGLSHSLAERLF